MVLDWFSGGSESVEDLIAHKKYKKATLVLRAEFQKGSRDPRLRQQLADVLILAGRGREAVPVLEGLGDEFARAGFAAKAIAILKRIDKIDPGRKDVARKLATLIERPREAPRESPGPPQDFREIGIALPLREAPPSSTWAPSVAPSLEEEAALPAVALPTPAAAAVPAALAQSAEAIEVEPEPLDDDLDLSLDTLVPSEPRAGEVVRSPLFSDFSGAELLEVMSGLELLSFEPGDVIITEGEPGDSLFVVSTGRVKAFVRNPAGRHVKVREMEEGAFFGEISILKGSPRTATVTAASRLELLELDKAALDDITGRYPRVREVLETFCRERAGSADEALVRGMTFGSGGARSGPP
jgi:hypothetical protein